MKYASLFHADPSIRYHGSSINRGNESNRCSLIFFLLLLIFIHVASFYIYIYIQDISLKKESIVQNRDVQKGFHDLFKDEAR